MTYYRLFHSGTKHQILSSYSLFGSTIETNEYQSEIPVKPINKYYLNQWAWAQKMLQEKNITLNIEFTTEFKEEDFPQNPTTSENGNTYVLYLCLNIFNPEAIFIIKDVIGQTGIIERNDQKEVLQWFLQTWIPDKGIDIEIEKVEPETLNFWDISKLIENCMNQLREEEISTDVLQLVKDEGIVVKPGKKMQHRQRYKNAYDLAQHTISIYYSILAENPKIRANPQEHEQNILFLDKKYQHLLMLLEGEDPENFSTEDHKTLFMDQVDYLTQLFTKQTAAEKRKEEMKKFTQGIQGKRYEKLIQKA